MEVAVDTTAHLYLETVDVHVAVDGGRALEGHEFPDIHIPFHPAAEVEVAAYESAGDLGVLPDDDFAFRENLAFNRPVYPEVVEG